MLEMNIAPITLEIASWKVNGYLNYKGPITNMKLEHLFSAAIALTQDDLASKGNLKGKRLTEGQIAEVFSADRNTTGKWKNILANGLRLENREV